MVYHNLLAGSDRFLPWAPVIESLDVNFLPTRKNSLSDEASKTVVVKYCRLLNEVEKSISFLEKKWQKICNISSHERWVNHLNLMVKFSAYPCRLGFWRGRAFGIQYIDI